jgi:hypothetical protein
MNPNFDIFGPNCCVSVRRRIGEWMISACVVPIVKHGGGGVMVWGCIAGDTVFDLFRIQGTQPAWLQQHSAAIHHPIWFALSGNIICISIEQ